MTMNKEVTLTPTRQVISAEQPPFVKPPGPSVADTFVAAFRTENTVVAAFKAISASQVEATDVAPEGYDQFEDIEGTAFDEWPDALVGVRTPDEKSRALIVLNRDLKDREVLAQSGFLGCVSMFVAGPFDPMIRVPVGCVVNAVRDALAGGRRWRVDGGEKSGENRRTEGSTGGSCSTDFIPRCGNDPDGPEVGRMRAGNDPAGRGARAHDPIEDRRGR